MINRHQFMRVNLITQRETTVFRSQQVVEKIMQEFFESRNFQILLELKAEREKEKWEM